METPPAPPQPESPPRSAVTQAHTPPKASKSTKGFTTANIVVISVVGLVSILIMLFGEFEGKGVRVFATLLLFAAFTGFSAYDGRKRDRPEYIQIAMIGNIYLVALGLILIWATMGLSPMHYFWSEEDILLRLVALIILLRLGMVLLQLVARFADSPERGIRLASSIAAAAVAATLVMYTLPIALDPFFDFPDFYWRLSVAALLVSALAISVGILLYWANREVRPVERRHRGMASTPQEPAPGPQNGPQAPENTVSAREPVPPVMPPQKGVQGYAAPSLGIAPWPVFPTGLPLPAKPNGRPDYDALVYFAGACAESERQWRGQ